MPAERLVQWSVEGPCLVGDSTGAVSEAVRRDWHSVVVLAKVYS